MARTIFNKPDLPRSSFPVSNAVRIGNLIFVSGFPGYDENVQVAKGDFAAQMRQALKNVIATLEYAGSSIDKIGKVNIYLDRRADIDELNAIYREFSATILHNGPPARRLRHGSLAKSFSSRSIVWLKRKCSIVCGWKGLTSRNW